MNDTYLTIYYIADISSIIYYGTYPVISYTHESWHILYLLVLFG